MTRRVLLVFGMVSALLLGVINFVYAQDAGPQNMAGPQAPDAPQAVMGTGFTYQGQLKSGGTAVSGSCEMAFRLYDAASAGSPIGSPITQTVTVNAGLFTTQLDFGASAFNGQGRWLETAVKCGSDTVFTPLSRQALTPAPYALALPGLRAEPNATSPNIIGGYSGNWITSSVYAATVAGGGESTRANRVTDNGGTVSGGVGNQAGDNAGTISDRTNATVAGGANNLASGSSSTVGGGVNNEAANASATVGGGSYNLASGIQSTVPGGRSNTAAGSYSLAAGWRAKANADGCFVWGDATNADIACNTPNQFLVRATGGVSLTTSGAGLAVDGNGVWHAGNDGSGSGLNADLLDGQDSSVFVTTSGTQTISGLKTFSGGVKFADGTTQTTAFYRPVLPGPGAAATVDSAGNVGEYTSITIGADGLALISYRDMTNYDLKVLHCGNTACNGGNIATTVDNGEFGSTSGPQTSITIGADGLGLVSYYDNTVDDLKVLHCGNTTCNGGNITTTVDSSGDVGGFNALTTGADGLGLISYYAQNTGDLKVLHCGNAACNSGNTITTVDGNASVVGYFTSITIGADGLGLISYHDVTNRDLKVLHCGNTACNSGNTVTTVDNVGWVGEYTSITIGTDGLGLISYRDATTGDLKVLHCGNAACTSGNTLSAVDSDGNVGFWTSITIGADGLGLISYNSNTGFDLKVLHCGNIVCDSGHTASVIDSTGDIGYDTAITLGADGLGLVSYYDQSNGDLKVFRCSNLTCTPYTRVGR